MDGTEFAVWQRVLAEPQQGSLGETLYRMAQQNLQATVDYRALTRKSRGTAAVTAGMLEKWERENGETIRGLFFLCTGSALRMDGEKWPKQRSSAETWMYQRALKQLQEYAAFSAQPKLGVIFGELAHRQTLICEALVRILGAVERK